MQWPAKWRATCSTLWMSVTAPPPCPHSFRGGVQQRVAIARALINRPPVILADEPTAPLDGQRALAVVGLLNDMARQFDTAIIIVTHDEKIIPTFKRLYNIRDGHTVEETPGHHEPEASFGI